MSLLFTKSNTLILLAFLSLIHIGCRKQRYVEETEITHGDILSMNDLKVPNGFNYETFKESNIRITVKNAQGDVYNNATIYIMDNSFELGGKILAKGVTDANGYLALKVDLPLSLKQLVINTNALNIPADVLIENRDYIELTMGGPDYAPNTVQNPMSLIAGFLGKSPGKVSTRLGTWNMSTGKPNYLQMPNDVITTNFLSSVNSFLPSSVNLPNRYPTFLDDNYYRRNILLTNTAEVFITFVKEGAGQLNTLFYYVYNVNYPPQKTSDIDSLIIIYPNTSFTGSGGDLATGNKVRLGQFGKDTVIAFGIIANGFNSSNGTIADVNTRPVFYGNKALNPETNDAYKQHLVFVYEPNTQRFVLGFEDVNRNPAGSSDNDFEDVVYYATINNVNNVNLEKIAILPGSTDSDGDGVDDSNDDYPIDPLKAFNNYYPSAQQTATVAFEDLWYFKGDYDMNDMVLDMRTNVITNAANKVVEYQGKYFLRASGGSLKSAFAVQFPVAPNAVSNITGASDEPNQSNLVLKVFDNVRNEQATWNTIATQGYVDSVPYTVSFKLTTPVDISSFGIGLHNPFIWLNEADRGRGWEIHLPGKPATSLADIGLYTQGDDDTQVSGSKKYLTKNNLPWAIATPERFDYPLEKEDITQTYLNFANWAQSAGTNYKDWYKNLPNYRNTSKIYVKP